MPSTEEIKKIVSKIDGFLADEEGLLLYNLAKKCRGKGVIVEIGSWRGTSTIWLANGSKDGAKAKVYAIDPHNGTFDPKKVVIENQNEPTTLQEFKKNINDAGVQDLVELMVKTSKEAAQNFDKPVELIFIDGDHKYESVKLDFDLWFPKVIDGGIMAFHDSVGDGFPGPRKLVDEKVYKSPHFKNIGTVNSLTFATKVKTSSLKDRIENRYKLFSKNFYLFAEKLSIPKPLKQAGKKIADKLLNYKQKTL